MSDVFRAPHASSDGPIDAWFTLGRFSVLMAFLILAMFPDVILGGRTFVFRDFGMAAYPLDYQYRESFWRGEIPLWDPLHHCGIPFLAQWNTLVLYPGSLIYLLLPLQWSLGAFDLLHLFLCGIAMYALAWNWTGNRVAATVAGIGFAFNGFTLNSLIWPNYMASFAWMPLVLLTVERAYREGTPRLLALAALTGAMQMLSGTPEIILLTWLLVVGLFFIDLTDHRHCGRSTFRLTIIVLLVACLAAAQLLPFLDLMRYAQRESGVASRAWEMPLTGWANLLVPLFRTTRTPAGVFFQEGQDFTSSYYLGIGVLALAAIACFVVPLKRVRLLAALTALCLVLALGPAGGVYTTLLKVFPPLGLMRFPVKFVMLPVFAVPLMAAFTVRNYLEAAIKARFWRIGFRVGLGFIICTGLLVSFDLFHPVTDELSSVTALNGLTRAGFLIAILALWFLIGRVKASQLQRLCALGVMVLLWMDTATHMPKQNPTVQQIVLQPNLAQLQEMSPKPVLGNSRAMLSLEAILSLRTRMPTNAAMGYLLYRLALYDDLNALDALPKVDGFFALRLRDEENVRFQLYPTRDSYSAPMADFLSVSQVTSPTNIFQWVPRSTYLAMITAGQAPVFLNSTQTLAAIGSPDFNPRTTVFLRIEDEPRVSVRRQARARITGSKWEAHQISAKVAAAEPALVVFGQAFYHNWKAYVDATPTPLLRANYAFQALQVPAGTHQIELRYEDNMFRIGVILSLLATVACILLWVAKGPRNTPNTRNEELISSVSRIS